MNGVYLTIRPGVARKGYGSIAHEAEGRMGYWFVALEGEGSNCFSITQLVGQKKAIINSADHASWKNIYLGIKWNK